MSIIMLSSLRGFLSIAPARAVSRALSRASRPAMRTWPRSSGRCVAPHSRRRGTLTPTPRQQGVAKPEASHAAPHWSWARLLKRVFALAMAICPLCRQGVLRMIAAITQAEVIRKLLRHLKLAADPPPLAPARARQATFDWVA